MSKKAVLYARISIASEESVSVSRQLALGRKYAEARDWEVVDEFVDEGVSATHTKPENRVGWRALLDSTDWFDAVIVWKVDRLARRVIDFLHADEALQGRGAAIVCVEQSIDMTTGEGRAFAQMLAVFGELEAAAISSRMVSARSHLIKTGRVPGGVLPYGWHSIPNPDGPGRVLAQDPERIDWMRAMVARALRGETVNSIARWMDSVHAPLPRGSSTQRTSGKWGYTAVHRLLANPLVAGMILHNPGTGARGTKRDVLRDQNGVPTIREDLAILSLRERDKLIGLLEHKAHRAAVGRELRATTSPILAELVWCGACVRSHPMRRGTHYGRGVVKCPQCYQLISLSMLVPYLERRLLAERGSLPMFRRARAVPEDPSASLRLQRVERELQLAAQALTEDSANTVALGQRIATLKGMRAVARRNAGAMSKDVLIGLGLTVEDIWRRCSTDLQRREVLDGQIERLTIHRGNLGGRHIDPSRVELTWRAKVEQVAPDGVASNPVRELYAKPPEWISVREAVELSGCTENTIRKAAKSGAIEQRKAHRVHPSLSAQSVSAFVEQDAN